MDKVIISNLLAQGILGIHDWERVTPRDILITVTIYTDTSSAAQSDDIVECIDYSVLAKKLRAHVESAARKTVEALANDLADICLQDARVARVILRVDKPGAVPDTGSVGVEVDRTRQT